MEQVLLAVSSFTTALESADSKTKLDAVLGKEVQSTAKLLNAYETAIGNHLAQILPNIDPAQNSILFLGLIQSALQRPPESISRSALLDETLRLLLNFDPIQIRYVGSDFRTLLEQVATGQVFSPLVSVEILASAMFRLDPSGSMFTSTHILLAKLAYQTACIEPALKVLQCDITFYPGMTGQKDTRPRCDGDLSSLIYISTDTGLTDPVRASTILEYNLLCGLCYMQRREWSKACQALERVISHPTRDKGVSKIMDEAFKRWTLVGLLSEGKEPTLPPYTSASAKNTYSALESSYKSIATLFSTTNAKELKNAIDTHQELWEEDGTQALASEVASAYQKWQIINLRHIYNRVSISQVRRQTLSAETGEQLKDDAAVIALVRDMVESGLLKGELLTGAGGEESYLVFYDDNTLMSEPDFAREIAERHARIQSLSQQYQAVNERLSSNKEYVRQLVRDQRRAENDAADPISGFDAQIEDEDLMTGIMAHG